MRKLCAERFIPRSLVRSYIFELQPQDVKSRLCRTDDSVLLYFVTFFTKSDITYPTITLSHVHVDLRFSFFVGGALSLLLSSTPIQLLCFPLRHFSAVTSDDLYRNLSKLVEFTFYNFQSSGDVHTFSLRRISIPTENNSPTRPIHILLCNYCRLKIVINFADSNGA
jgi:hypothetical protein